MFDRSERRRIAVAVAVWATLLHALLIRPRFPQGSGYSVTRLVICVRSVFIRGQRVKGRTVFKWTIGVIAIVVLISLGAVLLLFVPGFMSLENGEQHRRRFQAELDSGRWGFGDQPGLFAAAQGIVKNPEAIRIVAKGVPDLQARTRWRNAAQLRYKTIVAATRISRGS
jgi:hypothetical protein